MDLSIPEPPSNRVDVTILAFSITALGLLPRYSCSQSACSVSRIEVDWMPVDVPDPLLPIIILDDRNIESVVRPAKLDHIGCLTRLDVLWPVSQVLALAIRVLVVDEIKPDYICETLSDHDLW